MSQIIGCYLEKTQVDESRRTGNAIEYLDFAKKYSKILDEFAEK